MAQTFAPATRSLATTLSIPFFSMVRRALVVTFSLIQRFSSSSQKRCSCRFGRKRRFFLLLACETRLPTVGRLPVTSQTRDLGKPLRIQTRQRACFITAASQRPQARPLLIANTSGRHYVK